MVRKAIAVATVIEAILGQFERSGPSKHYSLERTSSGYDGGVVEGYRDEKVILIVRFILEVRIVLIMRIILGEKKVLNVGVFG
ncbi:hypothetical protein N7507_005015 [Penicillium longicatenatum]|nr:hypothetical protein N7507_005015 [Penicillium longicatenatum]